ncbi:MAG: hypothetical protein L3J74_13270 [Bacteroidales bacterium]|nr:hypothetical protein [Bacteroidales bacterium]
MTEKTYSETKREYIENYFFSKKPQALSVNAYIYAISVIILFSVASMLMFQSKSIAILTGATIGLLFFRIFLYPYKIKKRRFEMRVPDVQINKWLIEDLKIKIKQKAIDHLLLHDEPLTDEQFIIIPYPVFHPTQKIGDEQLHRVSTKDGFFNYSVWNVQVLVLGMNYLSYYFCSYNWLDDTILNEKSSEFFYEDIALVKSDVEQVNFACKWNNGLLNEAHILKLINISGDFLYLVTELPELQQSPDTVINQEHAVQVLRIILRQIRKNKKPNNDPIIQFPTGSSQTDDKLLESA